MIGITSEQKEIFFACLAKLGLKRAPPFDANGYGEVCLSHPDGVYFNFSGPALQLIIVGPLSRTPFEICQEINGSLPKEIPDWSFWIKTTEFMPGASDMSVERRQILIERSIINAILVNDAFGEKRPQ